MKPQPIPTKSSPAISYALLLFVAIAFIAVLATYVNGTLFGITAEVGRLMLGLPQR